MAKPTRKHNLKDGETISGYFRAIFRENPKLLKTRSNQELLDRWLKDHPGQKEVPHRVKQNLANIKSVLRKKGRKRKSVANGAPRPVAAPRSHDLEGLEENIDGCLSQAKMLDREGLDSIINLLRRARNEVVWKLGQ
jgi:two-component sensor histidine kinase